MRKSYQHLASLLMASFLTIAAFAQQNFTITGYVRNSETKEGIPAVSILVHGTSLGGFTDDKGAFRITVLKLPATLTVSSIGFATKEIVVSSIATSLSVELDPSNALAQDVVVSASRVAERILESPVSIERVSAAAIRNAPSPSYYDVVGTLKGVDLTTSSFAFRTPSTRGFNGSGNLRFNQLVDGMDNQAPALNFSIGSIVGLTELDVESMELLPGASSALYGSGGTNGTLLINSKNPFKYQGLSFQIKQGVNHVDNSQRSAAPYYDWSLRWAKKVSEKFAFKIGGQFIQVKDWQANDLRNLRRENVKSELKAGDRQSDNNYDGVNVFGDEASASMGAFAQAAIFPLVQALTPAYGRTPTYTEIVNYINSQPATSPTRQLLPFAAGLQNNVFGNQFVSRTGYDEKHLVDYDAYNVRLSAGLNYKITDEIEASFLGYLGLGTSVYTGADRYSLKNLKMGQYKLELKSRNWFLRGYTTQENSGDSYTATTAALFINNSWKSNQDWFAHYTGNYAGARLMGAPDVQAHTVARTAAEQGRIEPGTPGFDQAFANAINTPIGNGGAKFADNSSLYHYEGQLNLTEQVKVVDVLIGANFRTYVLNSRGTIFADTAGKISINEVGGYLQLQKRLLNDILKLTGSIRYDKNENFEGRFTPRISALIKVAADNNIRMSYQTAYRFPSTQDQYINLLTGGANRLIGGLPSFNTFFKFPESPAYTSESIVAYRNSVPNNPALLNVAEFTTIKPERVQSFELGYKGLITKKFLLDVYGYHSRYAEFIGRTAVGRGRSASTNPATSFMELASPFTTNNYSFVSNSPTPVKAIGFGLGVEYNIYKNYLVNANFFSDRLQDIPPGLITFFNTPKYRVNAGFSSADVIQGWGFNVNYRWQDQIFWEGTFGSGEVPAYSTMDVMVSKKVSSIKSLVKIGATNLFNKYYRSAFGNPEIGGLYYVSFGYNIF